MSINFTESIGVCACESPLFRILMSIKPPIPMQNKLSLTIYTVHVYIFIQFLYMKIRTSWKALYKILLHWWQHVVWFTNNNCSNQHYSSVGRSNPNVVDLSSGIGGDVVCGRKYFKWRVICLKRITTGDVTQDNRVTDHPVFFLSESAYAPYCVQMKS